MVKIFVSYRRSDSEGYTGRLFDNLMQTFERSQVFLDVDSIEPGENFVDVLDKALDQTHIMLVVIGPSWLTVADTVGRRRIDNPEDFVRKEIATALKREISVIPILVGKASMPSAGSLPDELSELSNRQAISLHHENFVNDVQRLAEVIKKKSEQQKKINPSDLGLAVAQEYNRFLEFVSPVEIDFVQMLESIDIDDIEWFYNPRPRTDQPRFVVRGLPELDDKFYRLEVLEEVDDTQHNYYSELSETQSLLIALPTARIIYDDLQDYVFWQLETGAWSEFKYVRCEACETLQIDLSGEYDDPFEVEGMYEEWCPHCETSCERCGERTGRGGFCSVCQTRFEQFMSDD